MLPQPFLPSKSMRWVPGKKVKLKVNLFLVASQSWVRIILSAKGVYKVCFSFFIVLFDSVWFKINQLFLNFFFALNRKFLAHRFYSLQFTWYQFLHENFFVRVICCNMVINGGSKFASYFGIHCIVWQKSKLGNNFSKIVQRPVPNTSSLHVGRLTNFSHKMI